MTTKRKSNSHEHDASKKNKPSTTHWATGLLSSMKNPEYFVQSDDTLVVIKDKYPKAEYHYLILPKENISSLKAIKEKHLELLQHMHNIGEKLAADPKHKSKKFKLGYHSEASMFRLHLHVISDDMNSPYLRTKKHWNSFNSPFFVDSKDICDSLKLESKIKLVSADVCKKLLNAPLKCHKCEFIPKNIPDLKKHILIHMEQ